MRLKKIISGGQTGSDRGGLRAAIQTMIEHGGSCPKGRKAEDGVIPSCFHLKETESDTYPPRTWRNVRDSKGTIIFTQGPAERGSKLTIEFCKKQGKPWLHVDLGKKSEAQASYMIERWIERNQIDVCNVAGNRESKSPGIEKAVTEILVRSIVELRRLDSRL